MKYGFIKVASATPKIRVADCKTNTINIIEQIKEAHKNGASLVVFPELCVTGYTCSDLFYQRVLLNAAEKSVEKILKETADLDAREIDAANSAEQENIGQKMDIYRSLKTLKEIERTCITLFYMEDLSIEKIAGITGIPTGTVKSHLSRGKEKLATYLKQNGYDKN